MRNAAENTTSMIVLIDRNRGVIQAAGATVEAAQAELDGVVGESGMWTDIYEDDYDDGDHKGEGYKALRVPAGNWTGSDADAGRAQEIGETVGWYARRDKLRIGAIRIEPWDDDYAVLADVDGEEELEWLDEDGDVVTTPGAAHLDTNRSEVYGEDEIGEIQAAMQAFIDALPEADREELREACEKAKAARDGQDCAA